MPVLSNLKICYQISSKFFLDICFAKAYKKSHNKLMKARKEVKKGGKKAAGKERVRKKKEFSFLLNFIKSLSDRSSAVNQPLKVVNPLSSGKWSLGIVSKEFVYSKYVYFCHSIF